MDGNSFFEHLKRFIGNKKIIPVQFTGGEPLFYFDTIKLLYRRLTDELNVHDFWFSTNGKLLTDEIADFIIANKINISISYDGDGQPLRGYDLEHDGKVVKILQRINKAKLLTFLPVMTCLNKDLVLYVENVRRMLKTNNFIISNFNFLSCKNSEGYKNRIQESDLPCVQSGIYYDYINGKLDNVSSIQRIVCDFLANTGIKNYPKCLAEREDFISLDMEGNILVCHNFNKNMIPPGSDPILLGNIRDKKFGKELKQKRGVWIDRRRKQRQRPCCADCLVRYFCYGGCMFQDSEYREYDYMSNFYFFLPFFRIAAGMISGKVVERIVPEFP
jgi:uncharacterized protein